jgi:hypothetical protein
MPDESLVLGKGDEKLALKCLSCGTKMTIMAGPPLLSDRINDLEAIIDDLGIDPNPESEKPEDVVKRHHAKACEWARIATDACEEVRELQVDRVRLQAEIARLSAVLELSGQAERVAGA